MNDKHDVQDPLLETNASPRIIVPQKTRGPCHPKFKNYDENEETTLIDELTYLQFSPCWCYFLVPILSLMTALIFALFLFWYVELRAKFFYNKVDSHKKATHIKVQGRDRIVEIKPLIPLSC